MPTYIYQHPATSETKEIVQRMNEPHIYSENGIQWRRVFVNPNATVDSFNSLDPFDKASFVKRTAKPGMTVGEMWDESKKLSDKRAARVGKDFVRVNAENDYKRRTGKDHPEAEKPKLQHTNLG